MPGFGAGFEVDLEPSKLHKEGEHPGKGRFYFLRQTLRPCHIKNTAVVLIHYGGGIKIRRQQNTTARSLKHLVFLGKIHRRSPQIVN